MTNSRFWRSWPADIRIPFLLLLGLALVTILWSVYEYLTGPDRTLPWLTETNFDSLPLVIDQFSRLAQPFEIKASGYLISERYNAGLPVISSFAGYFYLAVLGVALVFYLAAITTLQRLPYAIGMLLFMLLLGSFNADALDLVQSTRNYFLIGALVAFGLLTYYFQAFAPNTSFSLRLLSIGALAVAAALFIYLRSAYDAYTTTLHLIGHSSAGVMIGGLLFTLLVGFENIMALLWLNGQGTTPQQRPGMGRFAGTSMLYLLSLLFLYLSSTGYFDVDVSFIRPFFLLIVSFVVGLWGFRQREEVVGKWLPYRPAGAFLYLCLAILAFLGAGYAFGTANDPITEAFNHGVLTTHLALGTLFFIYVVVNFGPAIRARLPVYRVVYQPRKFPFFTVYTGGFILLMALTMYTGARALYQAHSGYYNYLGDLYLHEGNDLLAERYYDEGNTYENNNVRSNISLAALADSKGFSTSHVLYLKRTLLKRPQEKMYVRLANAYANRGALFDAMFISREGMARYPKSHRLHNNMALLFSQTDVIDSMAFYIDRAQTLSDEDLIRNNSLALLLKAGMFEIATQVAATHNKSDYAPLQSNIALLNLAFSTPLEKNTEADLSPRPLTDGTFALLYHQVLARLPAADSALAGQLGQLAFMPENASYAENLNLLKALALHYHAGRADARKELENLVMSTSGNEGYYLNLLGLWLMEEELYLAAADAFEKARTAGYAPAYLNYAYALGLAGRSEQAINEAKRVLTSGNPALIKQSVDLQRLLETPFSSLPRASNDTLRVQLMELYRFPPEVKLGTLLDVQHHGLKAPALASVTGQYIASDKLAEAEAVLQQIEQEGLDQNLPAGQTNRLHAQLLYARKHYQPLLTYLEKNPFGLGFEGLKTYYRASALWKLGKPKDAAPLFEKVPNLVPYHADAIQETSRFYAQQLNEPMRAYELLLSALAYNPYSVPLLKAYALQALELNLTDYAQESLSQLSELADAREYATFKAQFDQKMAQRAAREDNW